MRIYFNKQGDRPWSVDDGPMTPERTYKEIRFLNVVGLFVSSLTAGDNINTPTAWFAIDKPDDYTYVVDENSLTISYNCADC